MTKDAQRLSNHEESLERKTKRWDLNQGVKRPRSGVGFAISGFVRRAYRYIDSGARFLLEFSLQIPSEVFGKQFDAGFREIDV